MCFFFVSVVTLTGEVDWLLQVHHSDVCLFAASVVASVDDDVINFSGLDIFRVHVILSMESKDSQPGQYVDIPPVESS